MIAVTARSPEIVGAWISSVTGLAGVVVGGMLAGVIQTRLSRSAAREQTRVQGEALLEAVLRLMAAISTQRAIYGKRLPERYLLPAAYLIEVFHLLRGGPTGSQGFTLATKALQDSAHIEVPGAQALVEKAVDVTRATLPLTMHSSLKLRAAAIELGDAAFALMQAYESRSRERQVAEVKVEESARAFRNQLEQVAHLRPARRRLWFARAAER